MFSSISLFIFFLFLSSLFIIILLFSSRRLSPIPYFPSNRKDIDLIFRALQLADGQIVADLGAGDGWVVFEAAQRSLDLRLNTKFVAIEINPVLLFFLHLRRLLHPNRHNIRILKADMFTLDYAQLVRGYSHQTFYIYISPWLLEKVHKKIKSVRKAHIVSYMYPMPHEREKVKLTGTHQLFVYR